MTAVPHHALLHTGYHTFSQNILHLLSLCQIQWYKIIWIWHTDIRFVILFNNCFIFVWNLQFLNNVIYYTKVNLPPDIGSPSRLLISSLSLLAPKFFFVISIFRLWSYRMKFITETRRAQDLRLFCVRFEYRNKIQNWLKVDKMKTSVRNQP